MAVDVCSENSSPGISPRISFSHDLNENDINPVQEPCRRLDSSLLDSGSDFDFCISANSFLSSADELFSNGKILPVEMKKEKVIIDPRSTIQNSYPSVYPLPSRNSIPSSVTTQKKRLKEFLSTSSDTDTDTDSDDDKKQPTTKSFWHFKRSSSLNCESSRAKGVIRSFQFLSRSNSTGSVPNPKQTVLGKDNQRPNLQKQPSISSNRRSSSVSSFGMPYSYNSWQKPQIKKVYGNGVRVSPVLNFQPHISIGTVNLFGFGSLFCNGKVKKKKK